VNERRMTKDERRRTKRETRKSKNTVRAKSSAKGTTKNQEPAIQNDKRTIGILKERSLHAALKAWYARPGDAIEVPLDGYHIDLVRGDLLIEIQTRNFFALKRKLPKLLEQHRVRLVHPIAAEKWLVRVAADGITEISRRRSPKRGRFEDIFDELVHVPALLAHPNFSLEILLIRQEEIRRVRTVREKPARRTRFPRDWDRHDHRLLEVVDSRLISSIHDLRAFLPAALPVEFTNRDLAALVGGYQRAQSMTYVLRQIGILKIEGKASRSTLYSIVS
jgi:hypothetical protein